MDESRADRPIIQVMEYSDSKFSTLLIFFENLNIYQDTEDFRKKFDWKSSLRIKVNAVSHLSEEVKRQYEKALVARKEFDEKGFGRETEFILLLIKFETLLNSIYSLCDNLAFIGHKIHPKIKRSFNDQRNRIESYRRLYPEYAEYLDLIESADWYEKLHIMRTESTHYLPGFVFYSKDGLGILYQNMEHSEERIEIENIRDYVVSLVDNLSKFLERYGNYLIEKFLKEDHKIFSPCWIPHANSNAFLSGGRVITYSEYKNKRPGKCVSRDLPCPNKKTCPAYQHD